MLRLQTGVFFFLFIVQAISAAAQLPEASLVVQSGHSNRITAVKFSPCGRFIVTSGKDQRIILWHRATQKQFMVVADHQGAVTDLQFSSDGKTLVSSADNGTVFIRSFPDMVPRHKATFGKGVYSLDRVAGANTFLAAGDGITTFDLKGNAIFTFPICDYRYVTRSGMVEDACFDDAGQHIAYTDGRGTVISLEILTGAQTALEKGSVRVLAFGNNPQHVFTFGYGGMVIRHHAPTFGMRHRFVSPGNRFNCVAKGATVLFAGSENGSVYRISRAGINAKKVMHFKHAEVVALDVDATSENLVVALSDGSVRTIQLKNKSEQEKYAGTITRINDIRFTPDGKGLWVLHHDGTVKRFSFTDESIQVWHPRKLHRQQNDRRKIWAQEITHANADSLRADVSELVRSGVFYWVAERINDYRLEIQVQNDKPVVTGAKPFPQTRAYFAAMKDYLVHGAPDFLLAGNNRVLHNMTQEQLGHSDRITCSVMHPNGTMYAVSSWDGLITLHEAGTQKLLLTIGLFEDREFIMVTPSNHYFASRGALKHVAFRVGQEVFSFEQFDLFFNRPDKVLDVLSGIVPGERKDQYFRAWNKRLKKLGVSESDLLISNQAPVLEVTSSQVSGDSLNLILEATSGQPLSALFADVNGVPELTEKGMPLSGNRHEIKLSIPLSSGVNRVRLRVRNVQGMYSLMKEQVVVNDNPVAERTLYVVCFGVGEHQESAYNLRYAAKDAADFAQVMAESKEFDQVKPLVLTNAQVTLESMHQAGEFIQQARLNDAVVVFFAGHGVLNASLDYFLATSDMDFVNPEARGIPYGLMEDLIARSPCRNRLLLIDACHSGEIDKEEVVAVTHSQQEQEADLQFRKVGTGVANAGSENSFEIAKTLFADMRENNGGTVISSAGGGEYAMEGDKWQNGVFTYCAIRGIRDKQADLNKDGEITVGELHTYVSAEVNMITGGRQRPTSRVENEYNDFRLY